METQDQIRKAVVQSENDRKAGTLVWLEVVLIGIGTGIATKSWPTGIGAAAVLLIVFMIPYVRVLAYVAVSIVWAGVAIYLVDGDKSVPTSLGLGVAGLAFLMSIVGHFAFRRHMKDIQPSKQSQGASTDRKVAEAYADERECPMCAEVIKSKAKKCRYCGSSVDPIPENQRPSI